MSELDAKLKIGSLYRLIYDYFQDLEITEESQKARLQAYTLAGKKAKAFIARLVLMRIMGVYECYNDYYDDAKQVPIPGEALDEIQAEIKRGFFKKDLVFKDGELKEK